MCIVSKAWPARLLAATTAFALVVACVIGAYAHATGHELPQAGYAEVLGGAGDHVGHDYRPAVTAEAAEPGHLGSSHHDDGAGHSPLDACCDIICHGGQAILAADAPVLPRPHSVPVIGSVDAFDGAEPGGLDRPPKALPSA